MTVSDRFEAELAHEGYDNCEGELRELFDKIQIFVQAELDMKADEMLLALEQNRMSGLRKAGSGKRADTRLVVGDARKYRQRRYRKLIKAGPR